MSWVLKGFSCFGTPRRANTPPKLECGDWNMAVGDVDTLICLCASSRGWTFKIFCACAMIEMKDQQPKMSKDWLRSWKVVFFTS